MKNGTQPERQPQVFDVEIVETAQAEDNTRGAADFAALVVAICHATHT